MRHAIRQRTDSRLAFANNSTGVGSTRGLASAKPQGVRKSTRRQGYDAQTSGVSRTAGQQGTVHLVEQTIQTRLAPIPVAGAS